MFWPTLIPSVPRLVGEAFIMFSCMGHDNLSTFLLTLIFSIILPTNQCFTEIFLHSVFLFIFHHILNPFFIVINVLQKCVASENDQVKCAKNC